MRIVHKALAATAIVLAVSAAVVESSHGGTKARLDAAALAHEIEHEDDHVTALELAQWIRDRKTGLRVIDVRPDSEYQAFHIPSAERLALADVSKLTPKADETIVLYSEGGAHAAQGWVLLRALGHKRVFFLRGGLLDWMDDVMSPPLPEQKGNAAADSTRNRIAELSRYFGGVPRVSDNPANATATHSATTAAEAVAKLKRRGC